MESANQQAASRLRLALDLFATGEALMRQNLRRKHPEESGAEIERRLVAWLRDHPGASADALVSSREWPPRRA